MRKKHFQLKFGRHSWALKSRVARLIKKATQAPEGPTARFFVVCPFNVTTNTKKYKLFSTHIVTRRQRKLRCCEGAWWRRLKKKSASDIKHSTSERERRRMEFNNKNELAVQVNKKLLSCVRHMEIGTNDVKMKNLKSDDVEREKASIWSFRKTRELIPWTNLYGNRESFFSW